MVAKDSEQIGRELNDALTTQGIKFAELSTKLTGLAQREQQNVAAAAGDASARPAPRSSTRTRSRRSSSGSAACAGSRTRSSRPSKSPKNVTGERAAPQPARPSGSSPATSSGTTCSRIRRSRSCARAGDHRRRRARLELRRRTPTTRAAGSGRRSCSGSRGRATSGGTHRRPARDGSDLDEGAARATRSSPPSTENTVTATTDLGFAVTVEDTGDSQEVQVKVTLTIQQ